MIFGVTQKLGGILLLFVAFVAVGLLASVAVVGNSANDAIVVNVAGRQRLLVERMSNLSLRVLRGEEAQTELRERATTFDRSLEGLIFGSRELVLPRETDPRALHALQDVKDDWSRFLPNVETIATDAPAFLDLFRVVIGQIDALLEPKTALNDIDRVNLERFRSDLVVATTPLLGDAAMHLAHIDDDRRAVGIEDVHTSAAIIHRSTVAEAIAGDAAARTRHDIFSRSWLALQPKVEALLGMQRRLDGAAAYVATHDEHLLASADRCVRLFEERSAAKNRRFVGFQYLLMIASVLASVVAFLGMRRIIVRPLRRMIAAIANVGIEVPDLALEARRADEIGQLARRFTVTARGLAETVEGWMLTARAQELLARTGATLDKSLENTAVFDNVLRLLVPQLGDACVLYIAGTDGRAPRYCAHHAKPEVDEALSAIFDGVRVASSVDEAFELTLRSGRTNVFASAAAPRNGETSNGVGEAVLAELGLGGSYVCAPLRVHDQTVGGLLIGSSTRRYEDETERRLVEGVGERLALAIVNMRLYTASVEAVRLREEIIALVSHDLRSPLMIIQMELYLLENLLPAELRETGNEAIDAIRGASERMTKLTNLLLDVASIQRGGLALEAAICSTTSLVDEAVRALAPLAKNKGVALVKKGGDERCLVWCDNDRVQQVFANLLGNALKFTPSGKTISVVVTANDKDVTFEVKDEGVGIKPEHIERIFEPYWTSNARGVRGTGLGLYIARGIAEAHHGHLRVESELGVGSSFSFTLPLASPQPRTESFRPPRDQ